MGVFQNPQAKEDRAVLNHHLAELHDVFGHAGESHFMADRSAVLLAQTDGQHFHKPTFHRTAEIRVGLDTAHRDDMVCPGGIGIHADIQAGGSPPDKDGVHGGPDGDAKSFLRDAIPGENLPLAFRGGAAVAAHGRNDEDFRTRRPQGLHQRPDNGLQIADLPAAHADADAFLRMNAGEKPAFFNIPAGFLRRVCKMRGRKGIGNPGKTGNF